MKFFLNRFEEIIGVVCLGIMVTVAFVNVLTRYFFKYSMAFTEEITLYLFVWAVMMGTSIAFREGSNMAVTLFYERFRKGNRKLLMLFSSLLSGCALILSETFDPDETPEVLSREGVTLAGSGTV